MSEKRLYGWDIDRDRWYVHTEGGPYGDDGEDLVLYNGADIAESVTVNLELPGRGKVADFIYCSDLQLYVSERVVEIVKRGHTPNLRINPLVLRDADGNAVDDTYFWINIMLAVPLMDRERSAYRPSSSGGVARVNKLVIRQENMPPDDLFLLKELSLPVFSEPLVEAIEAQGLDGAVFEPLDELTWGI